MSATQYITTVSIELFNNTPFLIAASCALIFPILVWIWLSKNYTQNLLSQQQKTLLDKAQWSQEHALLQQSFEQLETNADALIEDKLEQLQAAHTQISVLQNTVSQQDNKLGELTQKSVQLNEMQHLYQNSLNDYKLLQAEFGQLKSDHESMLASFNQERKSFDEKLGLLQDAERHLNTQFENIANKIFEQKALKFSQSSETGLKQLLSPLKTQIDDFKKQIGDQYIKEGQERAALKNEILGLKELNQQITQEASALTNALKGDNKQQGNWGEVVLSRILSESGLRDGHEYEVQKHLKNQDGKSFRPDIVVHLPNDKDIVIDSKVSLVAHEKAVNADDDINRKLALKEHVNSIKGHIKGLSKKDYQDLNGVKTLDYVLMFIPIEGAFLNAVETDPNIIKLALDNQIMLVSPTNLLVALRTINNIWQYEYQSQHAKTIADKAKRMYDKFANFVEDMDKIGKNIDLIGRNYDAAMNKLSTGKGNLIAQAESFKGLGVTPTKAINKDWLAIEDDFNTELDDRQNTS